MKHFLENNKWPLAIFAAAFLIRLFYLIEISLNNPAFYLPMVDELWHLNWAKEIIGGNFWGDEVYFRGPLYPYLLALLLKISGGSIFFVRLVQMIVASGSAALVYLIGNRLFNKKVGIVSGLIYALYGTLMLYEAMLLIPVLFIFLNLLGFYKLLKIQKSERVKDWLIVGLIFGLAAIARPNILLLTPFFAIWIYFIFKRLGDFKKTIVYPLIFIAGVLIPVFCVTARNVAVTGEFALISSQGGVNLYIGNNPETEGLTMLMPEIDLNEALPWSEFNDATRAAAERESGRALTASEESSFWTGKAVDYIFSNPWGFVKISFRKFVYFIVGFENSDQTDIYQARDYSILYSVLLWKKGLYFPYGVLLPFAIAGIIVGRKSRKELIPVYIFIIGYIPTVILFLVTARHRLPIVPFLIMFASVGAIYFYDKIRLKSYKDLAVPAVVLLIALLISNRTYFDIGFENEFQTRWNLALTYTRQGDLKSAESEYKKALDINPNSATTLNNLGHLYYRQNNMPEALKYFQRAIKADPLFADAFNNIGLVYESRREYNNAIDYYNRALKIDPSLMQAYINIGDIFIAQNQLEMAESKYRQAAQAAPKSSIPLYKLGGLYGRMQRYAEAEQMFTAGEALGALSATDLVNWGNIYYAGAKPQQALDKYREAIALDPNLMQGYLNMAAVFDRYQLSKDSTIFYLNQVLRINPEYKPARDMLEQVIKY